jgi:hypothetical protein
MLRATLLLGILLNMLLPRLRMLLLLCMLLRLRMLLLLCLLCVLLSVLCMLRLGVLLLLCVLLPGGLSGAIFLPSMLRLRALFLLGALLRLGMLFRGLRFLTLRLAMAPFPLLLVLRVGRGNCQE